MTTSAPDPQPLAIAFALIAETAPPPDTDRDDLECLTSFVLDAEETTGDWEVTVALVDDVRLQALHRDFMGIDTPTDIMTFPAGEPGEAPRGGELIISVDHATSQAGAWGLSPHDEIRFLVIHGLLHLLGWRDDDEDARQRMLDRQQQLLDGWRAG